MQELNIKVYSLYKTCTPEKEQKKINWKAIHTDIIEEMVTDITNALMGHLINADYFNQVW